MPFYQHSSLLELIVYEGIQIEFLRALHQTDWTTAEHCIKHSLAFSKHRSEPLFLKLQLFLAQGTIHILRKHFFGERAQQKL